MQQTVIEYYMNLPNHLHVSYVPEQSSSGNAAYRMLSNHGTGFIRIMNFREQFLIVIADFTPLRTFEKVSEIKQEYFEISQFETDSSSFKVGLRKVKQIDQRVSKCTGFFGANPHFSRVKFCVLAN